ncbi:hypothetical protein FKM82_031165 [Ascaphus truei]
MQEGGVDTALFHLPQNAGGCDDRYICMFKATLIVTETPRPLENQIEMTSSDRDQSVAPRRAYYKRTRQWQCICFAATSPAL